MTTLFIILICILSMAVGALIATCWAIADIQKIIKNEKKTKEAFNDILDTWIKDTKIRAKALDASGLNQEARSAYAKASAYWDVKYLIL